MGMGFAAVLEAVAHDSTMTSITSPNRKRSSDPNESQEKYLTDYHLSENHEYVFWNQGEKQDGWKKTYLVSIRFIHPVAELDTI